VGYEMPTDCKTMSEATILYTKMTNSSDSPSNFCSTIRGMLFLDSHRQPRQQLHSQPLQDRIPPQIVHNCNKVQMLCNHLLPKMRFAHFNTVKGFSKCHFPQNIKCQHLKPDGHVEPFPVLFCSPYCLQSCNESFNAVFNNVLLLRKRFSGKRRREKTFHFCVLAWVTLASDAAAIKSGTEDIVKVAFDERGLAWPWSVDRFPGSYR